MAKRPRDSVEREIMDIIPERFDGDPDGLGPRRGGHTRLVLSVALGLLALAALGVAARHLLVGEGQQVAADSSVPIIKPDDKPIKTKPEDRGGMAVPNQDKLVYQDLDKDNGKAQGSVDQERLMPPAEKPQAPAKTASNDSAASSAMPPPSAGADIPAPPAIAAPASGAMPAPAPAPATEATPAAPLSPPPQRQQAAAPAPAPAPAAPPGKGAAPAKTQAMTAAPPPKPQTTASAAPAPAPAPAAKPAPSAGSGNYQVQLAAMKSEAEAEAVWKKTLAANNDLLSPLTDEIVRADLGAKGVYFRLRAGPLDEAAAKTLCAELVKRNQVCIVARK